MTPQISEKQLAANRANAVRSTGPRTAAGKSRAAQNARKHGLTGAAFNVPVFEGPGAFENLRADALDFYKPQNAQEIFAVERIALCQLNLLRAHRIETGLLTSFFMNSVERGVPRPPGADAVAQANNYAVALGLDQSATTSPSWNLLLRYQAQAERQYRRAVEEFERLHALRQEIPNEPISDPELVDSEPDDSIENEPMSPGHFMFPAPDSPQRAFTSIREGVPDVPAVP